MKTNNRMDRDRSTSSQIDGKLPPQAKEIEQIILGACLIESDAFEKIASELSEADFYDQEEPIGIQGHIRAIQGEKAHRHDDGHPSDAVIRGA